MLHLNHELGQAGMGEKSAIDKLSRLADKATGSYCGRVLSWIDSESVRRARWAASK